MPRIKDLSGQKVNMLQAIEPVGHDNNGYLLWKCICDCGNEKIVSSGDFRKGNYQSCGCYRKEWAKTHGDSRTRLYVIWCRMKSRCYDANVKEYNNYGGRGIVICDEWIHGYEEFKTWSLNNGYLSSLTIDRKDNNGNYSPENCQWITLSDNCKKRFVEARLSNAE